MAETDAEKNSKENTKKRWKPELKKWMASKANTKVPIVLVGTFKDLRDQHLRDKTQCPEVCTTTNSKTVREFIIQNFLILNIIQQGEALAKEIKAVTYVECSAVEQSGSSCQKVFEEVAKAYLNPSNEPKKWYECSYL